MAKQLYENPVAVMRAARRLRKVRRRIRYLIACAGVALVVMLTVCAFTSPHLRVNRVVVQGTSGDLESAALARMQAGIGANIFLAPLDDLRRRVAGPPSFRSVTVGRKWPLTLVATVRMRAPYAVVCSGQDSYLVDGEMVPYARAGGPGGDLPRFSLPSGLAPRLGQTWSSGFLQASVRCYEAALDRRLNVSKISIDRVGDMCLNIENGILVHAGSPQDIERKLWVVSQFLTSRRVPLDSIEYVDVSCPSAPAYAPKGAPAQSTERVQG